MFPVLYIIASYKINMWLAYLITGSLSLFIPQEIGRFYHVTIPHPLPSGSIQFVLWICESVSVLFVRLFCFYIPQRSENTQCFRRCREKGTLLHCCRNVNGCSHCGKQYGGSSKTVAQTVKRLLTMRETWVQSLGREGPLEKEMATHFSTLAWEIPWMEEACRLQSLGSQRVRHNWATSLSLSQNWK